MAKGATSKKKREEENRQESQRRQNTQQREETRQRQQRTQGNSNSSQRQSQSRNDRADSRQTTRREVAPAAIPVLEERSTPRRSASGRNVAEMFPEYEPQQAATIPVVQPIPTTNKGQGFQADLDQRMRDYYNNGTPIARHTSERAQETAEQPETTSMPVGTDMAEKGRKDAQRRSERNNQNITMPSGKNGDYQGEGGGRSFEKESSLSDIGQQTVDDINKKIDRLSVIPTGTLGAVDQKMSELYNDAEAIRALDNLSDNEKMDYLLDPEHRMSKYEQDYAKSLIDSYLESNPKAKELFNANNANIAQKLRSEMSEEERQEYERIASLANKTSNLSAYAGGLIEKIPFSNTVQKGFNKVDELMGVDEANNFTSNIRNAEKQSPLANMAGEMTTIGAEYNAVNNLLEGAPGIMNATNSIGTALAGGNAAIGGAVGNIIRGTMADIPLDTLTNVIIPGLQEGKSLGEITLDSAKNIGMNTLYNAGGEFIPYLFRGGREALENADDVIDAIKQSDEVEDAVKQNEIINANQIDDAGKQVEVPKGELANKKDGKISRLATNTIKRGANLTPEEYARLDLEELKYDDITERVSMENALKLIREEGPEALKERLLTNENERLSPYEIDALMSLIRTNNATARAVEFDGGDASAIRYETMQMFKRLRHDTSDNAQALQALQKWTRNLTPEGMLMHAENIICGNIETKKSKLLEELHRLAKRRKDFDFSPDFEKNFMEEAEKLIEIGDMDSREAKDIMANLGRMVNAEIPVKLSEKAQAFLMDNMLGNFRTLITRNAGGNVGLNVMEQTMTRPLAAGLDKLVSLKTGKRTQAGLSREALSEYIQGFAKGLSDEAHDVKTGLHTARSGENTLENAIQSNRHVFKTKVMDKLDSLVKNGLSIGDRPFYEATYKQTLGDYYRLRDQMGPEVAALSDEAFKEYAETAANLNALAAVYQNDSLLSKGLMDIKQGLGDFSEGALGVDILSQFSMPFVKTPANVVDRAIDYSPLGFIRNGIRTAREGGIGGEAFDQNRFVNETARNTIGTIGTGAGVAAARAGIMSGGYSDDKDEKQAQKDSGMQEYALNLPGNYQMDIGWAPVVGGNLVASAAGYDAYKNNDEGLIPALISGVEAGGKALFDQSFFQGLQRLFGTGESYNSDDNIVKNAANVVKQGLGQGIPSLVRQIAQVTDPYKRDVGNSNKDWQLGPLDSYTINSLVNNLPIARELLLAPSVDREGNLVRENQGRNFGMKVLEDMILPGKITHVEPNALDQEAARLSGITSNKVSYMPKATRGDVDTEEHKLTNDEWVKYQQDYYSNADEVGRKLIESDYYNALSPFDQESLLSDALSAVHSAEKSKYKNTELDGAPARYASEGPEGLINYLHGHSMYKAAGIDGNTNLAKDIQANVDSGNYETAEMLTQRAGEAIAAGLPTKGSTTYAYRGADTFPEMSTEEYAARWNILNSDGKGGVSQDDLLNAFNNSKVVNEWIDSLVDSGMSKEEALHTVWKGFLDEYEEGHSKEPYLKEDGTIGSHSVKDASEKTGEAKEEDTAPAKEPETQNVSNNNTSEDWLTQVTSNHKQEEIPAVTENYRFNNIDSVFQSMSDNNIDPSAAKGYWNHASSLNNDLTPSEFYEYFNGIDSALGEPNGGISKAEWVQYLNNNGYDYDKDMEIIEMLYNTSWPALKYSNEKWSK